MLPKLEYGSKKEGKEFWIISRFFSLSNWE
jgi:hypothetical protein